MCVIICKRRGLKLPSPDIIEKCFEDNNDGFGLSFTSLGSTKVTILKGAMTLRDAHALIKKVPKPKSKDMIFHFRTATHGKVCPENCHPFPLTDKLHWLKELSVLTPVAIAHNGIISVTTEGKKGFQSGGVTTEDTDTQLFIKHFLSGLGTTLLNKQVGKLIHGFAGGKFAILTYHGIYTLGDFVEKDGLLFSNLLWDTQTFYTKESSRMYNQCDFCGRYGELNLVIPYFYACRYCHIALGLPTKDFIKLPYMDDYLPGVEKTRLKGGN